MPAFAMAAAMRCAAARSAACVRCVSAVARLIAMLLQIRCCCYHAQAVHKRKHSQQRRFRLSEEAHSEMKVVKTSRYLMMNTRAYSSCVFSEMPASKGNNVPAKFAETLWSAGTVLPHATQQIRQIIPCMCTALSAGCKTWLAHLCKSGSDGSCGTAQ